MALGIQSYRSYPMKHEWERSVDSVMALHDRGMDDIIDAFSGWLTVVREPTNYIGIDHPWLDIAESDL